MKKTTIADVAQYANVSNSTVSQYLNKRYEYMSAETRKKIEEAIEALQYRPNLMARSLKQKSTFTIGIIVANIIHDFSTKIINALEAEFDKEGFHMIVCNSADNPKKEKKHIETLLEKQVDGLIVFPTGENKNLYIRLHQQAMPIVFIDRFIEGVDIPAVLLDNFSAMDTAVGTFRKQPIAFITTSLALPITPRVERLEGFRQALRNRDLLIDERYIKNGEPAEMTEIFNQLFTLEQPPRGIIAANDRIFQELMLYIKKRNIHVPNDVQVIAVDDVPYANFLTPSITTLQQPILPMAQKAASLLLAKIKKEHLADDDQRLYRFKPILIDRDSTN
ncbi:LacI family transcriptional regulator [Lysinibacillus sp. OL1_EC]|uniref:LacI family DNA-binding transcriptional regulator n=1 Tax=unclassified Lysinibacillus TaxID=2636778 RepID=UPI00103F9188|nr:MULTISPECIES: LacI family DNA-binding transcriptional regulator [unclassified Lysinibacillus]MCM0624805.1 LacI family transcriptional regulator [Lysinibacillus sp. OL1_EC]MCS5502680.1 LacI family transcriptional regulator [Lysinibacillus sp. A4]TBV87781.1 LacI family transcriptional regulator [Lysinibacillus sp. OL1]UKJ45268.1 LacI family transcriptional regulator [Lysinibacillus sp. ACHW1.5]